MISGASNIVEDYQLWQKLIHVSSIYLFKSENTHAYLFIHGLLLIVYF